MAKKKACEITDQDQVWVQADRRLSISSATGAGHWERVIRSVSQSSGWAIVTSSHQLFRKIDPELELVVKG